jgi:acylphosphatase
MASSEKGRIRLNVQGRVQGVFYRASTREEAVRLHLTGWVRNLPDGSVEILAEGKRNSLQALTEWCGHGPPYANVIHVKVFDEPYVGEFHTFETRL